MSAPSPIFAQLTGMLHAASERQNALDSIGASDNAASRTWTRQREGLIAAILAEPPKTAADGLIILSALSEWRDLLEGACDDMTARERRDLDEVTMVALTNVNLCFGGVLACHEHHTPDYRDTLRWLDREQQRWLPRAAEVEA